MLFVTRKKEKETVIFATAAPLAFKYMKCCHLLLYVIIKNLNQIGKTNFYLKSEDQTCEYFGRAKLSNQKFVIIIFWYETHAISKTKKISENKIITFKDILS